MMYFGIVEDRTTDPLKLGRVKVRIAGLHTEDKANLPTADLPWAVVMQPTNSSAMSGIGHSPTGIVEGTTVIVMFRDEAMQSPVVIGTLPGIPTDTTEVATVDNTVRSGDGTGWADRSGNPITTGRGTDTGSTPKKEMVPEFKKPSLLSTSEEGFAHIKSVEGLASTVKSPTGKPKIASKNISSDTVLYSYLDTAKVPVWTIGYGSTYLQDNSPVTRDTTITVAEADDLMRFKVKKEFEASIRRNIKAPLTQSMFDALVSMAYNMGSSGLAKSEFASLLNMCEYEAAAAKIPFTRSSGLSARRESEKALFLKDGIPQVDGQVKAVATEEVAFVADKTQNPVVIPGQQVNKPKKKKVYAEAPGFADPNNVYPTIVNEPDTNRLARAENLDGTIVFRKESARAKGIRTANGETWSQPKVPFNARYPHNHVYASESGHVQEFDDTPNNERIHWYHRTGTFVEVDRNGTRVNRIVGDGFEIYERNSNVYIRGTCNLTVSGDANIRVENSTTIESLGSVTVKSGGDVTFGVNGNFRVKADGDVTFDGKEVHLNSGKGDGVQKTTESAVGLPEFPPLSVPTRYSESIMIYETPEEGDPTAAVQKMIDEGKIDVDETSAGAEQESVVMAPKPNVIPVSKGVCDLIFAQSNFTKAFQISDNFTLGELTKYSKSGIPTGTNYGMSDKEIICNIKKLTVNCLEPIKKKFPNLIISSLWRSETHNKASGGASTSDHLFGCAADMQFTGFSRQDYYQAVQEIYNLLPAFHQLILEYKGGTTWIHVAYNEKKGFKKTALTIDTITGKKSNGFVLLA